MMNIPDHLKKYIVTQDYSAYTSIDHAVWRYILRQLTAFLKVNAHPCYLEGLEKTGVSIDRIPSIAEISAKIEKFGWRAFPVSGFIPPAAFMELQSLSILPIASDMRSLDHLQYTPAPDIVHEAAGHAPILVHPEFADYLKAYAQVAKNAIISKEDLDVYEAIRWLSDIKEDPNSSAEVIANAEANLQKVLAQVSYTSEASLLSRMNWWTAEYGLIGEIDQPKIFGAGLLSSIGESRECLGKEVKKIPLTTECINFTYDITEPQPQLFVAKSFQHLKDVLEELATKMSFRIGGLFGVEAAIKSKTVNTSELSSGLQISGIHEQVLVKEGQPIYIKLNGPTQLSVNNQVIRGHEKSSHKDGFGTPIGRLKNFAQKCLSLASIHELESLGLIPDKKATLEFVSGLKVSGIFKVGLNQNGRWVILTFENATVSFEGQTLFQPEWGMFDLGVGESIRSVFAGAADRAAYGETEDFVVKHVAKRNFDKAQLKLQELYSEVRKLRESKNSADEKSQTLLKLLQDHSQFKNDWLLLVEILEVAEMQDLDSDISVECLKRLEALTKSHPQFRSPIQDGIFLATS